MFNVLFAPSVQERRGAMLTLPPQPSAPRWLAYCCTRLSSGAITRCSLNPSFAKEKRTKLKGMVQVNAPALSETLPDTNAVGLSFCTEAPTRNSAFCCESARRSTTLMVPATDCVLNSAVAPRMISMRSIMSGAMLSSENPGGMRSPFTRICVYPAPSPRMRMAPPRPPGPLSTVIPGKRFSTSMTLVSPYLLISSWFTMIFEAVDSRRSARLSPWTSIFSSF